MKFKKLIEGVLFYILQYNNSYKQEFPRIGKMKTLARVSGEYLARLNKELGEYIISDFSKKTRFGNVAGMSFEEHIGEQGSEFTIAGTKYSVSFEREAGKVFFNITATPMSFGNGIENLVRQELPSNEELGKDRMLGEYNLSRDEKSVIVRCRLKRVPNKESKKILYELVRGKIISRIMRGIQNSTQL